MILAQVTSAGIGELVLGLSAVGGLVLLGMKMFVRKPAIEAEFVTKAEFHRYQEQQRQDMKDIDAKLDERFATLDAKRSKQVAELHDDIREVDNKLAKVLGKLNL